MTVCTVPHGSEEGKLSSTTLTHANYNGRITKRKAASPKKTTVPDGRGSKGRTLVLATPVKIRTKSSSPSPFMWDNPLKSMAHMSELGSDAQRQLKAKKVSANLKLPAFVWGDPESARGIDEADEEEMDRGLGADSDEEAGPLPQRDRGLLLVGETPEKL